MKRRIRRIRRALKRAGLYNAFHITLIAVLLTGFCVILFNVKEPEQQEKEPEEIQAEVMQNPETMTQTAESIEENAIKCFDIEKNDSYKNFSKVMDKANDILKESDKTSLTDDDKALINSMLPDYDKYPSVAKLQAVEIAKSSSKMATLLMLDERYNETVSEALES